MILPLIRGSLSSLLFLCVVSMSIFYGSYIDLLTQEGMKYRMPLDSTHYSRREHTPAPILTAVHSHRQHWQRMEAISGTARRSPCAFFLGGAREEGIHHACITGEL
jgi:hypothetical protein